MFRFPTAMLLGVVLVGVCGIAPAYGVQEVTLNELPPLQPLHWCKHSDAHVLPLGFVLRAVLVAMNVMAF